MSPQPKSERQSTANLRRSSRIKAGGSMNINSSNAIYVQSQVDWSLFENKSNIYPIPLENLVTNKITDFHVLLLSECHHDDDNSDIYKVAKIDEEFQEISSVLNHRFKSNKKRTRDIQLQMTWDNDPNPQWYDWNSTFGAVEKVQKYLNDKDLHIVIMNMNPQLKEAGLLKEFFFF